MRTRIGRSDTHKYLLFWCPGCDHPHQIVVAGENAWQWDGNKEAPTISPSLLIRWLPGDPNDLDNPPRVCHSFIKNGEIQFLGDCTHKLAGQTVPIPEWPEKHARFHIPGEET